MIKEFRLFTPDRLLHCTTLDYNFWIDDHLHLNILSFLITCSFELICLIGNGLYVVSHSSTYLRTFEHFLWIIPKYNFFQIHNFSYLLDKWNTTNFSAFTNIALSSIKFIEIFPRKSYLCFNLDLLIRYYVLAIGNFINNANICPLNIHQ